MNPDASPDRGAAPPGTQRWKIALAYDGRPHQGWQSQPSRNTIQDLLEEAFRSILGAPGPRIHASGRTDAGVHAEAQIAHVDLPVSARLDAAAWVSALNVRLPHSIRILRVEPVSTGFHARFSARAKTYRYEIFTAPVLSPFRHGLVWHRPGSVDFDVLGRLTDSLSGTHDFAAFGASRGPRIPPPLSTVRTMYRVELEFDRDGCGFRLRFTADGFLYRMVRLLTGGMLRCASGRWPEQDFLRLLHAPQPGERCTWCAPASGLYLESVSYEEGVHRARAAVER